MESEEYYEIDPSLIEKLSPSFNLLIVTATEIEEKVLHENMEPIAGQDKILYFAKGKQTYYLGKFGEYNTVHVACGEMGSSGANASIITTRDAIDTWQPKAVLMIGIAFGRDKKEQAIGDVLVSDSVLNYGPRKVAKDKEIPRGKTGNASSVLANRFKSVKGWKHIINDRQAKSAPGLVLSGEILIDNDELKQKLLAENPTAIGGEMEGSGIYAACDSKVDHWILVKGICDYADGNKKKKKEIFQDLAIRSAVSLCKQVFSSKSGFKDIGLDIPSTQFDLEALAAQSDTLIDGLPSWMRTHVQKLKNGLKDDH